METKGKNRKLAEFMGYELKWSNITDNWYAPDQWGAWQPDKDLNQLFSVVDRIRGIGYEEENGSYQGEFYCKIDKIIDFPDGGTTLETVIEMEGETRTQVIYAACLAAIDHINEERNG